MGREMELVTTREAATRTGRSVKTIRRWVQEGIVKKHGRHSVSHQNLVDFHEVASFHRARVKRKGA